MLPNCFKVIYLKCNMRKSRMFFWQVHKDIARRSIGVYVCCLREVVISAAAGYDMMSDDNLVCRSCGSNYETVIVTLALNSIWDWRALLRFVRSRFF